MERYIDRYGKIDRWKDRQTEYIDENTDGWKDGQIIIYYRYQI